MSETFKNQEEGTISKASTSETNTVKKDEKYLKVNLQEETGEVLQENLIVEGENLHGHSIEQELISSENINLVTEVNTEKQTNEIKVDQCVTNSNKNFPKFDLMTKTSTCAQNSHFEEVSHTPTAEEIDQIVEEVKNIKTESKEEVDKVKENLLTKQDSISEQLEEQNTKVKKNITEK